MARGFESKSKSVASEQEDTESRRGRAEARSEDPAIQVKRRRLELSRSDVLHQLQLAKAEAHREMLQRALAALEKELVALR